MSDLPSIEEELSQIFPSRSPHKDKDSQSSKKVSIVNLKNTKHCKRIARPVVNESHIVVNVLLSSSWLLMVWDRGKHSKENIKFNSVFGCYMLTVAYEKTHLSCPIHVRHIFNLVCFMTLLIVPFWLSGRVPLIQIPITNPKLQYRKNDVAQLQR